MTRFLPFLALACFGLLLTSCQAPSPAPEPEVESIVKPQLAPEPDVEQINQE